VTVQRHNTDRPSFGNTYGCADLEWSAVNLAEQIIAATSHLAHADEENFVAQFVG